jgi:Plasma-membrane choline transporter
VLYHFHFSSSLLKLKSFGIMSTTNSSIQQSSSYQGASGDNMHDDIPPISEDHANNPASIDDGDVPIKLQTEFPVAAKKCTDPIFAILFLGLFFVIAGYGFHALADLKNMSVCNELYPGPSGGGNVLNAFDRCFSFLLSDNSAGPGQCTAYAMKQVALSGVVDVEPQHPIETFNIENSQSVISLAALPSGAQQAYDDCVSKVTLGSEPSSSVIDGCAKYAVEEVLTTPQANDLYSNCLTKAVASADASALKGCTRYAVTAKTPADAPVFDDCWPSSGPVVNVDTTRTCMVDKLRALQGDALAVQADSQCFQYAVSAGTAAATVPQIRTALSQCSSFGLTQVDSTTTEFAKQCVSPVAGGAGGAALSCVNSALIKALGAQQLYDGVVSPGLGGILGQSDADKLNGGGCLSNLITSPGAASVTCLATGLDIFPELLRAVCEELSKQTGEAAVQDVYSSISQRFITYRMEILYTFLGVAAVGIALCIRWMIMISKEADRLIKQAIIAIFVNLLVMAGLNLAIGNVPGAVILLVTLVFKMLWFCWVWRDIMFAATVMKVALRSLRNNPTPFVVALVVFLIMGGWCIVWGAAYYKLRDVPGLAGFLLVLSFFWTLQVLQGILSVTVSGQISYWYFYSKSDRMPRFPTLMSLGRALTYSFGSICFGSLLVALLATFRYMMKKAKTTDRKWLKALIFCCLRCMEEILATFNMYAFVLVTTDGLSYYQAAKATLQLAKKYGLEAVINDTLIDGVLTTGRLMGALTCGGAAAIIGRWAYDMPWDLIVVMMIIAFLFGYAMLSVATIVVEIASATLFVDFVRFPKGLSRGHPDLHKELMGAWKKRHRRTPLFDEDEESGDVDSKEPMTFDRLIAGRPKLVKHTKTIGFARKREIDVDTGRMTLRYKDGDSGIFALADVDRIEEGQGKKLTWFSMFVDTTSADDSDDDNDDRKEQTDQNKNLREYPFEAASVAERDMWINGLRDLIQRAQAKRLTESQKGCCSSCVMM